MSRVYTIIKGHVKTWFRSRSTIFWTLAFPLLLIVLFGAIFGGGNTKFDLYVQNQDLNASTPTQASLGYVTALNHTGAFSLRMVPAETTNPVSYVRDDAQLHNRGQRLLVIPTGFQTNLTSTGRANIQLYMDQSDQASASLAGIVYAATSGFAAQFSSSTANVNVQQVPIVARNIRYIDFFIPGVIGMTLLTSGVFGAVDTNGRYRELNHQEARYYTPLQDRMDPGNGRLPNVSGSHIHCSNPSLWPISLWRHSHNRHLHHWAGRRRSSPLPWDRNGPGELCQRGGRG